MSGGSEQVRGGRSEIGVVVVTYHPSGDVESRLQRMAAQGGALVVVDNASTIATQTQLHALCQRRGWGFIQNSNNLGVGAAVNQGVHWLAARGHPWVILFDQDSEPATDMSERQLETLHRHGECGGVAVVGVSYRDLNTGRRYRVLRRHPHWPGCFQKADVGMEDLAEVTAVITSGALVRVSDFLALGGFDEGLFVDYVDTDYCLRCIRRGRLLTVSARAELVHRFGERKTQRWLGFTIHPTNHSALRHYYIARNRVTMIRRHGRQLHWLWFECATAVLWLFRVLTAEERKTAKLRAMLLGTWDGLRGRAGACPPKRQIQIDG